MYIFILLILILMIIIMIIIIIILLLLLLLLFSRREAACFAAKAACFPPSSAPNPYHLQLKPVYLLSPGRGGREDLSMKVWKRLASARARRATTCLTLCLLSEHVRSCGSLLKRIVCIWYRLVVSYVYAYVCTAYGNVHV